MNIAVIGREEFVIGFQLAGIRKTISVGENAFQQIKELKSDSTIGIIIIEQSVLDSLDYHDRMDIEKSIQPVFVPLSTEAKMDNLRSLIIKSIGIDLLK